MKIPIEIAQLLGMSDRESLTQSAVWSQKYFARTQTDEIINLVTDDLLYLPSFQGDDHHYNNVDTKSFESKIVSLREKGFIDSPQYTDLTKSELSHSASILSLCAFKIRRFFLLMIVIDAVVPEICRTYSTADKILFPLSFFRHTVEFVCIYLEAFFKIAGAFFWNMMGSSFRATDRRALLPISLFSVFLGMPMGAIFYLLANNLFYFRHLFDGAMNFFSSLVAGCIGESHYHASFSTCVYAIVKNALLLAPLVLFLSGLFLLTLSGSITGSAGIMLAMGYMAAPIIQLISAGIRAVCDEIDNYCCGPRQRNSSVQQAEELVALHPTSGEYPPTADLTQHVIPSEVVSVQGPTEDNREKPVSDEELEKQFASSMP